MSHNKLTSQIEAFLVESVVKTAQASVGATALYGRYLLWAASEGLPAASQTAFGRQLNGLGYHVIKRTRAKHRYWLGMELLGTTVSTSPFANCLHLAEPISPTVSTVETVTQVETVQTLSTSVEAVREPQTVSTVETVTGALVDDDELAQMLATVSTIALSPREEVDLFLRKHCETYGKGPKATHADLYSVYVGQGGKLSSSALDSVLGDLGHLRDPAGWVSISLGERNETQEEFWMADRCDTSEALDFMDSI